LVVGSLKNWRARDGQFYNHRTVTGAHIGKNSESVAITSLAALPGGDMFVSGSGKGSIKVWDPKTCVMLEEHAVHTDAIHAMATNGSQLFTASADRTVKASVCTRVPQPV
jgi:WD40 repeat protein